MPPKKKVAAKKKAVKKPSVNKKKAVKKVKELPFGGPAARNAWRAEQGK